jgi:hypothetical protein
MKPSPIRVASNYERLKKLRDLGDPSATKILERQKLRRGERNPIKDTVFDFKAFEDISYVMDQRPPAYEKMARGPQALMRLLREFLQRWDFRKFGVISMSHRSVLLYHVRPDGAQFKVTITPKKPLNPLQHNALAQLLQPIVEKALVGPAGKSSLTTPQKLFIK